MSDDANFTIADLAPMRTGDLLSWRKLADGSDPELAALLIITLGDDAPRDGPICADMMFNVTGTLSRRILSERPSATAVYVIYWPGMLEIPWPEGMTAQQAVADWKDGLASATREELIAGARVIAERRETRP